MLRIEDLVRVPKIFCHFLLGCLSGMTHLILPHQLFEVSLLPKAKLYIIWEHPHYFRKWNYNTKKLILHRASMRAYCDELRRAGLKVKYVELGSKATPQGKMETVFDPIDDIDLPEITELDSPNFFLGWDDLDAYRRKTKKYSFAGFYNFGRKVVGHLVGVPSQDKRNRNKPGENPPRIPRFGGGKYLKEAIAYVEKNFPNNYGDSEDFWLPITREEARIMLRDFMRKRFAKFGKYQDSISKKHDFMFHSCLSSSLNIGLLNPSDILAEMMKVKGKVSLASYEGFYRQLFWREYQRYCYIWRRDWGYKGNYFGGRKKLGEGWWKGTVGNDLIDFTIKKGWHLAYLHHIERLMIVGNYMLLSGVHPREGFKWFMEFSCDSYEWVMHQNVYDMVFHVSGGKTMRRPYISSSNYLLKMSDWKRGEWADEWDELYRKFVKKHRRKLRVYG